MGFSNSGKYWRRKKMNGRDGDSNVNADNIPANSRGIVKLMKNIVNCSEQEIYAMLMECDMDADEAVNRLLSQAKDPTESVLTSLKKLSIENDEPKPSVKELQHLRFGSGMNGSGQPNGLPSRFLNELSLVEEEEQGLRRNVANELKADQINSNDEPKTSVKELEHFRFGSRMNGSGQPNGLPPGFLNKLLLLEEEEQRRRRNVARNYHSSSNYDQIEPTQENQNKSSSATDFTFDNSRLFNPVMSPSEPSLLRQNFNTFPNPMNQQAFTRELGRWISATVTEAMASSRKPQMNRQAMNQQAYTREQDPQYSASPLNQSMPTASSHALVLASINKPQMNGQAMNQQAYTREPNPQYSASPLNQSMPTASSLDRRPSASDIEALVLASINKRQMKRQVMNQQAYTREPDPPYSASPLNQSMPTASSHGRWPSASEIEAQMNRQAMNQQAYTREPDLPQSAVPVVPSANGSAYGFGMSSDNAANSRFGSDDVLRSQLSNHLPSFQHQNRSSNVLAPQGHQNEQSPSLRHSQQQEQEHEQQPYTYRGSGNGIERSRRYQRNNRRDLSNQTQQKTRRRNRRD